MIKEVIKSIKQIFIPKSEFIEEEIDYKKDSMPPWGHSDMEYLVNNTSSYTGVPAPAYLPEDPLFPTPVFSEKQLTVKESHEQAVIDKQILDESEGKESADIHQKLYELASKNWNTVDETQFAFQGGSENFQGGPNSWQSGTGYGQFR
jgi:hypothetical protein